MKKLKNEVLIMMSTYNGEKYIREQLDSIENQKLDIPLSILIRDDGSNDKTKEIIKEYKKKYKNIKLITGKNIGCNASFFELFKIAEGYKYYSISDQDDIWNEDKLQKGIEKIKNEKDDIPILYGSCSYIMDNTGIKGTTQKQLRPSNFNNYVIQTYIPGHTQIMNNELMSLMKKKINYSKIYCYDNWPIYIAELYGKIIFDNNPSTKYRIHNENVLGYGKNKLSWIKERLRRFKKGDGKKIRKQVEYFYNIYKDDISTEYKKEIEKFLYKNKNFFSRIHFVFTTKLYRQKKYETLLFKIAYLFKMY